MNARGPMLMAVLAVVLVLCVAVYFMWQGQVAPTPVAPTDAPVADVVAVENPAEQVVRTSEAAIPLTRSEEAELTELLDLLAPDATVTSCAVPDALQHLAPLRTEGPMGVGKVPWLRNEGGKLYVTLPGYDGSERLLHQGSTVGWLTWKDGACTVEEAAFSLVRGVVTDEEGPVEDAAIRGCEPGTVVRTDAQGRFSLRIARRQVCQPVVAVRIDGVLWFDLPERLGPVEDDEVEVAWSAPGPQAGRSFDGAGRDAAVAQIDSLRRVMADQLDPVLADLRALPPHVRPLAEEFVEQAEEDRARVLEPLDELMESGASNDRFEDFILLGEAMF